MERVFLGNIMYYTAIRFVITDQLQEIRNVRLARLVCDNTDIIDTIQMYPMVLPDHELYVTDANNYAYSPSYA